MTHDLYLIVAAETAKLADPAIVAMAEMVRTKHAGVVSILAYGSTLRDISPDDGLIDLYVLTETHNGVSSNPLSRLGCAAVPPNVYYAECEHDGKTYRAKYACLPLSLFAKRVTAATANPYFWARFAQPSRIIWAQDEDARNTVLSALVIAATTAFANAKSLNPSSAATLAWTVLFQNTYRTELRPEAAGRAEHLVKSNSDYYSRVAAALADVQPINGNWTMRCITGKALSVLRLIKASFTFQGGADYIAWKIRRHSGIEIEVTDWHRRHPLLAGIVLLPKLLGKGAVK